MHFFQLLELKLYDFKWFKNRLTRTLNIFGRVKLHSANFLEFVLLYINIGKIKIHIFILYIRGLEFTTFLN